MKKLFYKLFIVAACFCFFSCSAQKNSISFEAMNTFVTIQSYGKNAAKANQDVKTKISQIENSISTTKNGSYIYKINHSQGQPVSTDEETFFLVNYALDFASQTQGALNIALYPVIREWGFTTGQYKIPQNDDLQRLLSFTDYRQIQLKNQDWTITVADNMELDLGAVGKGFAGDQAVKILQQSGVTSALMDLGGNIQALGKKPDGSLWTIGIKNPWGGPAVASVKICDQVVITSGGYERNFIGQDGNKYIHIFDSKTGKPVQNEVESVSIVCSSGLYGDSLSTSMFAMGVENACNFWRSKKDFDMIIITKDESILFTPGLKDKLAFFYDFKNKQQIE